MLVTLCQYLPHQLMPFLFTRLRFGVHGEQILTLSDAGHAKPLPRNGLQFILVFSLEKCYWCSSQKSERTMHVALMPNPALTCVRGAGACREHSAPCRGRLRTRLIASCARHLLPNPDLNTS